MNKVHLIILLGCLTILQVNCYKDTNIKCADKFWAIAHLVNNENILDYSLEAGANAVEMDLNFDAKGHPATFYHSKKVTKMCDCLCAAKSESCQFKVCGHHRPARAVLSHFMSHKKMGQVAMLYLDSKMGEVPETLIKEAGAHMIKFVETEVLQRGTYKGIVLIGGGSFEYLESLASNAKKSAFTSQIFVSFDSHKNFKKHLTFIAGLDYPNKFVTDGISKCLKYVPWFQYEEDVALGRINKARGVVTDVIAWTLDKEKEFDNSYAYGARGIITNEIKKLVDWAEKRGIELYTTSDTVCGATAGKENLVTDAGDCACMKDGDGCQIEEKEPAPAWGSACRCFKQHFFWKFVGCKGDVVGCEDVTSAQCRNPDSSFLSCQQGGGDCNGY